jgi:DNA-directed RNA polymerase subunit RPC12/RpoP
MGRYSILIDHVVEARFSRVEIDQTNREKMMLIDCSECGTSVSDKAPVCVKCGSPITATTVEQTGKRYKARQLLAAVAIALGFVIAARAQTQAWSILGTLAVVGGFGLYLVARVGAWWNHG